MYQVPVVSVSRKESTDAQATSASNAVRMVSNPCTLASLRLIATSDLHASLMPYDYCANRPNSSLGLGAISQQIADARGEVQNCLLFDNGD